MAQQLDLFPGDLYDMMTGRREIAYRIYPSLLDKYQSLLEYEMEADKPWNIVSEKAVNVVRYPGKEVGDYILSPDQMYDKIEQELIDTINREPREPSEAADRGTAFNEVIDCLILKKACDRDDMQITSLRDGYDKPYAIRADYDGFTFTFDLGLCRQLRDILAGSVCQYCISAPIDTRYGQVLLYGFMDYWQADRIIDLKTTSQYTFGNYERRWQRYVYPYCAITSGLTDTVSEFTYLVAQLGRGAVISGSIYPETYTYRHDTCVPALRDIVESFIQWLESPRIKMQIREKKIFNILDL